MPWWSGWVIRSLPWPGADAVSLEAWVPADGRRPPSPEQALEMASATMELLADSEAATRVRRPRRPGPWGCCGSVRPNGKFNYKLVAGHGAVLARCQTGDADSGYLRRESIAWPQSYAAPLLYQIYPTFSRGGRPASRACCGCRTWEITGVTSTRWASSDQARSPSGRGAFKAPRGIATSWPRISTPRLRPSGPFLEKNAPEDTAFGDKQYPLKA